MVSTEIVNGTDGDLELKEGNAGVYRDMKMLEKGKKQVVEIDPNATYREYVVVHTPTGDKVFVTSDDCIDNAVITIIVNDEGKYVFTPGGRGSGPADRAEGAGFMAKMLKKVWRK